MFQIALIFDAFAWMLLLLCIMIVFLQLTPWFLEANKAFLDWWNFHLDTHGFAQAYASQSNVITKFFANRFGRLFYLIAIITMLIGLIRTSFALAVLLVISGISIPIIAQLRYRFKQRLAMEHALPDVMTKLAALISAGQPLYQAFVDRALRPTLVFSKNSKPVGSTIESAARIKGGRADMIQACPLA